MGDMTVKQGEIARSAIQVGMLVKRLNDYAIGAEDAKEMSVTQIQAAKILLDKSLPSLQSADITAHSSPQIESEEALIAQLRALIVKYPSLINEIQRVERDKALPAPLSTDVSEV
jgi:hypothetical protein